ncbi:MAG: glycerophosphodiester phosphodiesterase family protein [Clostridiaceae bacterium]|nr:glycerophosphodiester phosphodiesterase family protein [Clostridiaceae bacterium]
MNTDFYKRKTWISSAHQGVVKEAMHSNTLSAYYLAAQKGADMIETDARMTKDGVLIVNHDADVKGYDKTGNSVRYVISETDSSIIMNVILSKDDFNGIQYVPTLEQALRLAYFTGMCINIDLKDGITHAAVVARLVVNTGMRGRTVYATNGAGAAAIKLILEIDPQARFIDTKNNFTSDALADIEGYPAKCYVYTSDFSNENIAEIRKSGCMLATISLNSTNAEAAFRHHPDMAEYPHTSDFEEIDRTFFENWKCF